MRCEKEKGGGKGRREGGERKRRVMEEGAEREGSGMRRRKEMAGKVVWEGEVTKSFVLRSLKRERGRGKYLHNKLVKLIQRHRRKGEGKGDRKGYTEGRKQWGGGATHNME